MQFKLVLSFFLLHKRDFSSIFQDIFGVFNSLLYLLRKKCLPNIKALAPSSASILSNLTNMKKLKIYENHTAVKNSKAKSPIIVKKNSQGKFNDPYLIQLSSKILQTSRKPEKIQKSKY